MMIAICGDCGWLGGPPDLKMVKGVSDEMLEDLNPLMRGNTDASYLSCPNCGKSKIFYKNLGGGDVPSPSFLETSVSVPSVFSEPTSGPGPEVTIVQNEVPMETAPNASQVNQRPKLEPGTPPLPEEFIPPPEVDSRGRPLNPGTQPVTETGHRVDLFRCYCDDCGDEFKSKAEGQTRCAKCLRKLTGKR